MRDNWQSGRSYFVVMLRFVLRDGTHWADKKAYLALGTLLLGVTTLGFDTCTIEGFDRKILDEELGLSKEGLVSTVIVALGYRASDDFNVTLPKSRLPAAAVISHL